MKAHGLGVGRPPWGNGAAAPQYEFSHRYHHHASSLISGKGSSKLQEQTLTTTGCTSGRLVASSHQYGPVAVSFVGLRELPKKARDAGKFRNRFGELGGDCCQSALSLGSSANTGTSRNCKIRRGGIRATAGAGAQQGGSSSDDSSRGDAEEEAGSSSVWDLPARHKRMKEAAAKVGDPFRDMMTNASKKLQDYLDNIKLSRSKAEPGSGGKPESVWEGWQKVFADVDERERLVSVLKYQLEEAVDNEDFQEAAKLKQTIASASASDLVCEVMSGLKTALEEERYSDAARFRDKAGAGLVGWWVGLAEGGNDPYGRIIHIAASQGRFIAKSYSARQLATAGTGIPLFEVFLRKDGEDNYDKQAVYLQREGNVPADSLMGPTSKDIDFSGLSAKNGIKEDLKTKDNPNSSDNSDDASKNPDDFIDEGINNIISFLKDRMPDVRLNVLQVIAPEDLKSELPKLVEQIMEAEEKADTAKETEIEISSSSDSSPAGQSGQDQIPVGSSNSSSSTEEQETPIRLVIGGVLQNTVDDKVPRAPLRVAAKIELKTKDEFVFHIEDTGGPSPASTSASTSTKESLPAWKVATIATQASADLMPDDVAKVLWNVEKVPVKVSKEMGEIIRLAVSQAQRRRGLSKSTSFRRINVSDGGTDPLSGLYIGAFGPYTSEVVQLRRKYGQWQEDESSPNVDKLEFFEYVEAVKLTGDLNVPAGQVTFRAKIGRENRLSVRGAYPEELGVVGRYKGQGRLAEPGFRNPQWIDGEMVLLDGKQGGGHTNGAELGFVYSVPERHFLVLFNRLKLQD
ncbi:unnamed protein product [Calypogeia fissa]